MRSGTHKRPSVRVGRVIGPQNRGATGKNAGQRSEERSFSLEIPNAVHFPSSDEERKGRHRHRVHADRLADRRRCDRRHEYGRHARSRACSPTSPTRWTDRAVIDQDMGGPATGRPFLLPTAEQHTTPPATFLTKVTRWMVVPVGQADRLDHQMLPRLPSVFCRLVRNQRGVTLDRIRASGRAAFRGGRGSAEHLGQAIQNV